MRSEARACLARMTEERGVDGALRIDTYEGADLSAEFDSVLAVPLPAAPQCHA